MQQIVLALRLALRDWLHERTLSFCAVLALAGMLAPILVLQGVRNGVITAMRDRLLKNPTVLVISPYSGKSSFSKEWIAKIGALPGARFAIGRIREIAMDVTLTGAKGQKVPVHMEPSGPGEPVLEHFGLSIPADLKNPGIVLSTRAAEHLSVSLGDTVVAQLARKTREGRYELFPLTLSVCGILPKEASDRQMAFLPLAVLEAIQDYRDGIAVPSLGMPGETIATEREYASFRLYADSLDSVEHLTDALKAMGVEVRTKAPEIAAIRALDTALRRVILILSLAIACGFAAFSISSAKGAVQRKLRMLGLLRLFGLNRASMVGYPLAQSCLTSLAGIVLALVSYGLVSFAIDSFFADQSGGMRLCALSAQDFCLSVAGVLLLSGLSAVYAAYRAASVDPSSVIREV
ncbi:MAG: hypothetical protein IJU76_07320 [Desulfovibrionaceae bacterium]|nr:hypothetical protein [Desulfovibrionaceae bacterium]